MLLKDQISKKQSPTQDLADSPITSQKELTDKRRHLCSGKSKAYEKEKIVFEILVEKI